jgi:enoyl-CoA hydratase
MTDPGSTPRTAPTEPPEGFTAYGGELADLAELAVARGTGATLDGVVLVTLDLPGRRNMMSAAMTGSWARAMGVLRTDPAARAVVVTGAGTAFCSGGDLSWIGAEPDSTVDALRTRMAAFYRAWLTVRDLEVPTIAAVNGPAIGAGLAVALACDVRFAAADARLGMPFTTLGMHPGMASTYLLPEVAGLALAREMLLTGRLLDGTEAAAAGLVSRAVPGPDLLPTALAAASAAAAAAPVATRLTKRALLGGGHASYDAALEWEALAQPVTLATDDLQEGLRAARERRPPRFTGR